MQRSRIGLIHKSDWRNIRIKLASIHKPHISSQDGGAKQRQGCFGRCRRHYEEADSMSRRRYSGAILLALLFPFAAHARGKNSSTYDGVVDFGAQLLHLDDGCLSVDGRVTSGNFFDDLKRTDIGGRLEYRKHGRVVTQYPESLTTSIRIAGDPCVAALSNSPSSVFRGDSYSLKFKVEWKDGMHLRPAVLSPAVAHCVGYSSITGPGGDVAIPSIICQMTVDSKGIPIADHLIVSIFAADGKRLTRISAAP